MTKIDIIRFRYTETSPHVKVGLHYNLDISDKDDLAFLRTFNVKIELEHIGHDPDDEDDVIVYLYTRKIFSPATQKIISTDEVASVVTLGETVQEVIAQLIPKLRDEMSRCWR